MSEELRGEAHKEAERQTPFNGWENAMENAALQQKFVDGAMWAAGQGEKPEPTIESIIDDIVALPNEDSFPMAFSRSSAAHIAPSVLKIVNKYRPTTAKDTTP